MTAKTLTEAEKKKASMGDPSEIEGPVEKKAKSRKGDKSNAEGSPHAQGSSGINAPGQGSKASMVKEVLDALEEMDAEDLQSILPRLQSVMEMEDDETKKSVKEMCKSKKMRKEDLDLSADLEALFGSDDELTEEAKTRIQTIFETAIVNNVNVALDNIVEDIDNELEVTREALGEEMVERVDDYLNYVIEHWLEENKLAVEAGLKEELATDFIGGLHKLFAEHYIEVPEDRLDILADLEEENKNLKARVNDVVNENVEIENELNDLKTELIIAEASDDLTDLDAEKFEKLAEGIDFTNEEDFRKKLGHIKEAYFDNRDKESILSEDFEHEEEPVEDLNESAPVDPAMRNYLSAISRTSRR